MLRSPRFVIWAGMAINLIVVWILPIYLTQDGPSHLYNAHIFTSLIAGDDFYSNHFMLNVAIYPNWSGTVLLSLLTMVFSPLVAEKIWLTFLMWIFMQSSVWVINKVNPDNKTLALGVIFLTQNYFFLMGFYNYILGVALLNIVFCLAYSSRTGAKDIALNVFWSVAIFFTHPVAYMLAFGFVIAYKLGLLALSRTSENWSSLWRTSLSWLPSLLLFGLYFLNIESSGEDSLIVMNVSFKSIARLFGLGYMDAYGNVEKMIYGSLGLMLLIGYAVHFRQWLKKEWLMRHFGLISVWLCCLLVFLFVNDVFAGGSFFARRITLVFYMVMVYLLASLHLTKIWKPLLTYVPLILLLVLVVSRIPVQWDNSKVVKEYMEASDILPQNSTVLPLQVSKKTLGGDDSKFSGPAVFSHISGYLAVENDLFSLDNYEAKTDYFPVIWIEEQNPYEFIENENEKDDWNFSLLNLDAYQRATGMHVDHVIFLGDETRDDMFTDQFGSNPPTFQNQVISVYEMN